jgi:hypothetical protein
MDIEQLYEAEKRRMDKMHLQLPNIYKKVDTTFNQIY